jgi:3-phosphoshikimate 1-carboxyvinyltransferase
MLVSLPPGHTINPVHHRPAATILVPGSKSITNRALVVSALTTNAREPSELHNALCSEDTQLMIQCLQALWVRVLPDWRQSRIRIWGWDRRDIRKDLSLHVGNSGTTMRFLTALVSLGHGRFRLDGVARMRERPMEDLLIALRQLGVNAYSEDNNGRPPVIVNADGLSGGHVRIKGDRSSQFLSGLLMVAPLARADVSIEVEGALVSWPYIAMTLEIMRQFGVHIEERGKNRFLVPGGQQYLPRRFDVEPDASAASYFFGAAALTGGEFTVPGLTANSLQGDLRFVELLEKMGCRVVHGSTGVSVRGGPLHGIDADMNDISDTVMTLAVVACFAQGPTTIRNVAHIRHKESDRLAALATELRRAGAEVEEYPDGLKIIPRPLHGADIETYNDHRMAMSMALIGLRVPGIVIKNPECVSKTYPDFFDDLEKLR